MKYNNNLLIDNVLDALQSYFGQYVTFQLLLIKKKMCHSAVANLTWQLGSQPLGSDFVFIFFLPRLVNHTTLHDPELFVKVARLFHCNTLDASLYKLKSGWSFNFFPFA